MRILRITWEYFRRRNNSLPCLQAYEDTSAQGEITCVCGAFRATAGGRRSEEEERVTTTRGTGGDFLGGASPVHSAKIFGCYGPNDRVRVKSRLLRKMNEVGTRCARPAAPPHGIRLRACERRINKWGFLYLNRMDVELSMLGERSTTRTRGWIQRE